MDNSILPVPCASSLVRNSLMYPVLAQRLTVDTPVARLYGDASDLLAADRCTLSHEAVIICFVGADAGLLAELRHGAIASGTAEFA